MSRRWLVAVSIAAHAAVGVGLVVSGVWRIDRLEASRLRVDLVTPVSPPAPAPGGPVAVPGPDFKPKERKKPTEDLTQLEKRPEKPAETETSSRADPLAPGGDGPGTATDNGTCRENCPETQAPAPAPVCGDRMIDLGEQCDDGNATNGDGCSSSCRTEPPRPPGFVPPTVLQGLRFAGETQVHPSAATQHQMMRNEDRRVQGVVRLCLATNGSVASATMQRTTRYPDYDEAILSSVRRWRYHPYTVNGTPVPACSTVTFLYSIR